MVQGMTALDIESGKRRSRMRRSSTGKRVELTKRDLEIFKLLARYRFLRSTYIHAFVGGNRTKLIERLGHLYHEEGYLDRPAQQWEAVNARYMPVAYELGERGRRVLADAGLKAPRRAERARQYRHEAMICDILASIELESRATPGVRFIPWEEILASAKMPVATRDGANPRAVVTRSGEGTRGTPFEAMLVPDAIFGIEYENAGKRSFRFFALEADRNTEPVVRRDNGQSSYGRKIAQYQDVIRRGLFRDRWGLPNLLVLTVTVSEHHTLALLKAVQAIGADEVADHFLFRSIGQGQLSENMAKPLTNLLTTPWRRAGFESIALT